MDDKTIREILLNLLNELFSNSDIDKDVFEYVDIIDDLGMDSLTFISIIVEIENSFDIIVPDDLLILDNFRNFECIFKIIKQEILKKQLEEGDQYDKA